MGSTYGKYMQVKQDFTSLETSVESISFIWKLFFTEIGSLSYDDMLRSFGYFHPLLHSGCRSISNSFNKITEIVYILKLFMYSRIKHNTHNLTNALENISFGFFHSGTDSGSLKRLVGYKIQSVKNDILN